MVARTVRWTQPAVVSATVDVDLDELAEWAAAGGAIRTLTDQSSRAADVAGLRRALENNPHLHDELLRRWAAAHLSHS